jgi:archaeal flagellar protein FlaG
MSSETIVTAIFLIAAVIAAGVLLNAAFPIISQTASTFGSVTQSADTTMRTDIKIVSAYSNSSAATIWMKNIGGSHISPDELNQSDIFIGTPGAFERYSLAGHYQLKESINNVWDPGETLVISISSPKIPSSGGTTAYFAIVLKNGIKRSHEFTTN